MRLLVGVRVDFRARPFLQPSQIARVIQMPMGQENGFDGLGREAQFADESADQKRFADHAGVNQHACVPVGQQETAAHEAADGMQVGGTLRMLQNSKPHQS